MVQKYPPTVLSSRTIPGILQSSSSHNLAWSSDGQCLVAHRRGVNIFTPYITSTLPPPAVLVDPHLTIEYATRTVNRAKRKAAAAEEDDVEMEEDEGPTGLLKKCRRPAGGEMSFWSTGITLEAEPNRDRQDAYGWNDVGDETNGTISDREVTVKKAIWSPSGMSSLGGCVLAILTSHSQVSVYAPRSDPSSQRWDEVADLTILTKHTLPPRQVAGELSIRGMMEMRTIDIEWSHGLPASSASGESGGILAISSRAGTIGLWTYGTRRRFERVANIETALGWASHLAWSEWRPVDGGSYEAKLAYASSDGTVSFVPVRQAKASSGKQTITLGKVQLLDEGDQRTVTCLRWLGSLLVWSKAATVHLWNSGEGHEYQWREVQTVRLERVGGWASANALGAAVDFQFIGSDGLLVTLASMTRHMIGDLHTCPILAPLPMSLRLSVATRDCFLDFVHAEVYRKDRYRPTELDDQDVSARTGALASIGRDWGVASWSVEAANYHNLNSSTEGGRLFNFMLADLSGALGDDKTILERLEAALAEPPRAAEQSPAMFILPFVSRVLSSKDPQAYAQDLLELCSSPSDAATIGATTDVSPTEQLMRSLWDDVGITRLRLRYVLALWASTHHESKADVTAFKTITRKLQNAIRSAVLGAVLTWTVGTLGAMTPEQLHTGISDQDSEFMRSSAQVEVEASPEVDRIRAALSGMSRNGGNDGASSSSDLCPACHLPVSTVAPGIAKCGKGHEWARCAITNILITDSTYRVCNTCPGISLFPQRQLAVPIPVSPHGDSLDWQRSTGSPSGEMVEQLLEAATVCVMCGGRWIRSM